MPGCRR